MARARPGDRRASPSRRPLILTVPGPGHSPPNPNPLAGLRNCRDQHAHRDRRIEPRPLLAQRAGDRFTTTRRSGHSSAGQAGQRQ